MLIRFWGSRGSLPVSLGTAALQEKLVKALVAAAGKGIDSEAKARAFIAALPDFAVTHTFGGNSSCVQIDAGGGEYVICDMGSGARELGNSIIAAHGPDKTHSFHVFVSHVHWDHIMGFPFFAPAYRPGNRIRIYGCHEELEQGFRKQHSVPSFPIDFDRLPASIEFVRLTPGRRYEIAGMTVTTKLQAHSGDSYGYRFESAGKSVVYSTDSEHKLENLAEAESFADFFREADLVIFDAMYSLADAISVKEDWGHSSNIVGVELCQMAGAKRMCLFHHEPIFDDEHLAGIWRETRRLEEITRSGSPLEILAAYDGLEIVI
jgi:phosphoribosyl 1,2-cyclic phosphodiesterase